MNVIWTDPARADLAAARDYIALDDPAAASRVADRIIGRTEILADLPLAGAVVPEYADEDLREVLEYPYRIIYRVYPDRVDITAVVHGARRLPRGL